MKKGIFKIVIALMLVLSFATSAVAAEINCSPWAKEYVDTAAESNLVPTELLKRATDVATRKELCEMIMTFYETKTGAQYEPTSKSPFSDADSAVVISAVELGFFSGISETKFDPEGKVTREQLASVMTRLADKLTLALAQSQDATGKFNDDESIASWARESVYVLKENGIMAGNDKNYFNPKDETTIEQTVIVLTKIQDLVGAPIQTTTSKTIDYSTPLAVQVGSLTVSLGDSKEQVVSKFGQPDRIETNIYGIERYVYNKNYSNFIMIGIDGDKVVGIYTNAASFSYGTISTKTKFEDLNLKKFAEYSSEKALYISDEYRMKIFFDISDEKVVDSIHLMAKGYEAKDEIFNVGNETNIEADLFDIINSARVKNECPVLIRDEVADAVSQSHAEEMKSLLKSSYMNVKGLDPFERLDKAGISYSLAAENISGDVSGDAIDIYAWWMSHLATRGNILDESFTHIGIGVSGAKYNGRFYTTVDLYCE